MKPAIEWLTAIGESTMADILLEGDPGCRTERVIAAIQADALRHAASLFDKECCKGYSWTVPHHSVCLLAEELEQPNVK